MTWIFPRSKQATKDKMRIKRSFRIRMALFVIICLSFIVMIYVQARPMVARAYFYFHPSKDIFCYWSDNDTKSIADITSVTPEYGSIFFHETSCKSSIEGKLMLDPRQACAVESAAKANPNRKIYLLFGSPGLFKFENTESDRIIKQLLSYENVHIYHVNIQNYVKGTPVENLWSVLKYSWFPQSHTSDVLRYLTLWRYGGIYLDLDVIVLKSLDDLPPNYGGLESYRTVAAGVISIDSKDRGKKFAEDCINDLKNNFNGYDWGWNGPGVITRLSQRLCGRKRFDENVTSVCKGFTVYPTNAFYPVQWSEWYKYFEPKYLDEINNVTKDSHVIHVWNKFSVDTRIPLDSNAPYLVFARQFCPKVVKECDKDF